MPHHAACSRRFLLISLSGGANDVPHQTLPSCGGAAKRTMYSNTKNSSSFSRMTSRSLMMAVWLSLRRDTTCTPAQF